MTVLVRWFLFRRLLGEKRRTLLTIAGVALGVGVVVGIRLANHSALGAFADTVDAVSGRANLQVTATSEGFDERVFPLVTASPGVTAAAPVVQVYVRAFTPPDSAAARPARAAASASAATDPRAARVAGETLLLLGVEPLLEGPFQRGLGADTSGIGEGAALLLEPRAAAIPRALAQRNRLRAGDPLAILASGRPETLVVRAILDSPGLQHAFGGNIVLTDIATAQEVLRRPGRIDRIDLLVDVRRRDAVRASLAASLPPDLVVDRPGSRTKQVEGMVEAFSLNLTALSFIALFVAVFLVLNAVGLSVLRWRRDLGILRTLGVTRRELLLLFAGEGALLGSLGGVLGVGLGVLLARATLGAVSQTLSDLYLVRQAATVRLDPATLVLGLVLGFASAVLAAAAPAWEAASTPPATTTREGAFLESRRPRVRGWLAAGAGSLLLAGALSWWTVAGQRPIGGFASAFSALAGFALLAPVALRAGTRALDGTVRRLFGVAGVLGARYVGETVLRSSVVISAIMVAVGMTVAMSIMVGSFRTTVDRWITQTLRGDLYVEPVGHRENASATSLPAEFLDRARALPGVEAMDTYRGTQITHGGRIAFAAGIDFEVQRDHGHLDFVGLSAREAFQRALDTGGCIVTESFAHRHGVARGDTLRLRVPAGAVALPVAGVFFDYSVDAGAVLMDRRLFARLWRDDRTESLALYLESGADPQAVRRALLDVAGPGLFLQATPNRALRARVLEVFDQTFRITWALQAIAVIVSVLGVAGSLTALILQRGREIGVLRAVGALRSQVRTMVLVESGLLGAIGALLGCVAGVALSAILVHVINKQFFGWTVRWTLDPWVFVQAVVVMVATACLAGLAPARLAAGRVAREAMRMD